MLLCWRRQEGGGGSGHTQGGREGGRCQFLIGPLTPSPTYTLLLCILHVSHRKKNVQKKCKWTIDEEEGKTEKRQKQCQMPPSVPPSLFAACKIRHRRRRGSPPPFEINGCKPHGIYMGMETAAVKIGDTFATFLPDQVFQLLRCGRSQTILLPPTPTLFFAPYQIH